MGHSEIGKSYLSRRHQESEETLVGKKYPHSLCVSVYISVSSTKVQNAGHDRQPSIKKVKIRKQALHKRGCPHRQQTHKKMIDFITRKGYANLRSPWDANTHSLEWLK